MFILGFALAITLGYVFHAWYFSYLTSEAFFEYTASLTADLVIPTVTMGLFSYGIFRSQGEETRTIQQLQNDIHEFCVDVMPPADNDGTSIIETQHSFK